MEVDKEVREDVGRKGNIVREKEEDGTAVQRKCVNLSVEAFDIFSQGDISECDRNSGHCLCDNAWGGNSDCESGTWSRRLVSTDVHVPPFLRGVGGG